ncbi:DnaD domain-containing protein [Evansella clarkii]|uniref:DnaD domain-containing protein n=1 Tax=Evansella clarkii TaxID=79879 RepID=UPI0009988705|nr:DnaD domain-containing protein [Evansella clarkii]
MNNDFMLQLYMDDPFTIPSSVIKCYGELGISEQQFMLLMHIRQFSQEGNFFPTPFELQERMTIDELQCANELKELLMKGFLAIEEKQDEDGRLSESFSLKPLFEKVTMYLAGKSIDKGKQSKQVEEGRLFRRFEEEFSRPLSPMEMEMISMWLDDDTHAPEIIEAALREAVVSSKMNFRYIDRILFEWKKNGVRSVQQAREHGERIRRNQPNKNMFEPAAVNDSNSNKPRHPRYNWLQGGKR